METLKVGNWTTTDTAHALSPRELEATMYARWLTCLLSKSPERCTSRSAQCSADLIRRAGSLAFKEQCEAYAWSHTARHSRPGYRFYV